MLNDLTSAATSAVKCDNRSGLRRAHLTHQSVTPMSSAPEEMSGRSKHGKLLISFLVLCAAHLCEHAAQAVQVYGLGWELHQSRGILGHLYPWLVHSEILHWGYAAVMLAGLWHFRNHWSGAARSAWRVAAWVQTWHFFEHCLLFYQAVVGENFFNAPQPISMIQLLGFLNGSAESGFGGLLKMSHFGVCDCKGAAPGTIHSFTWLLIFVRRVEVHLMYNLAVTIPMVVAMLRARPSPEHGLTTGLAVA